MQFFFGIWGAFPSGLFIFLYMVSNYAWKWSHQGMGLVKTWNNICLCLIWDLLFDIQVALFSVCCHYLYHHHNQQLICHQQFQTNLAIFWIFHLFFCKTYCWLALLQMAVTCICISQTSMQMWSSIVIGHLPSGYDMGIYVWGWDLYGLVVWVLGYALLDLKHNPTFPFGFGTSTKLLHISAVSSTPGGMIMSSCCSCSSSTLNGLCNV